MMISCKDATSFHNASDRCCTLGLCAACLGTRSMWSSNDSHCCRNTDNHNPILLGPNGPHRHLRYNSRRHTWLLHLYDRATRSKVHILPMLSLTLAAMVL